MANAVAEREQRKRHAAARDPGAMELLSRDLFVALVGQSNHHSMSKDHLARMAIEYAATFYTELDKLEK